MYTKRALGDINIYAMKDDLTTQELSKEELMKIWHRSYYIKNKERLNKKMLENYYNNKQRRNDKQREYRQKNKKKIKEAALLYYYNNKEHTISVAREYKEKNKEKINAQARLTYNKNKEQISAKRKQRLTTDAQYKIRYVLRCRIGTALKLQRIKKSVKTVQLIGCSIEECRAYIEKQWLPGMSWSNHALKGWHIDHIKPCNTFDLTDPEQQRMCFHYTNLRPLWYKDNLSRPRDGSDVIHQ
jgi:hypothetical protein